MSDPTQTSDTAATGQPDPATRSRPSPAEPGTATAGTHSRAPNPETATAPPEGVRWPAEPFLCPTGFDILRELGSGGMGTVYEALQHRLNRSVALKVLRAGRGDVKDVIRFLAEAEAIAAIRHPHVVQVYEFGQETGQPFMALELLSGGTLADRLRAGKLEPRDAVRLLIKLADAVRAAHELGIVHRDLKPGNVLFDDRGEPKITDFGLAKRTGGADLTRTQAVMGTPAYMAPEQARGDTRFVGAPADVWALGAILYECLTGKRPFDADDTWAVLRKVTDEAPPRPHTHVAGLPRDLELIVLKCLEKSPAERYPSVAALADDLTRFLEGRPVSLRPAGLGERFVKSCRRNPVIAGFTAALLLVAFLGFAGVTWGLLRAENRGRELAKANENLSTTLTELTRTNDDLTTARNVQTQTNEVLKTAQAGLLKQAGELIESREAAETRGYLSDVALAHQLWRANDLVAMRAVLERCPPQHRKWEWHYLNRLSLPERAVYPTDSPPLAVLYSPNGKYLASLTLAGTLTVQDVATGQETFQFTADKLGARNRALAFRPDGNELTLAISERLWVLDLETRKLRELPATKSNYLALSYTKDGRLLGAVELSDRRTLKTNFTIRDVLADKTITTLPGWEVPRDIITEVAGTAFSADGTRFAASGVDSGIRVSGKNDPAKFEPFRPVVMAWDINSSKLLQQVEGGNSLLGQVAFSPDGRVLGYGGKATTIDVDNGSELTMRSFAHAQAVAFDRNGLNFSGGEDKLIQCVDYLRPGSGAGFVLRGGPNGILRLAVSPDGKEIAAGVGDLRGGSSAILRYDVETLGRDMWRAPTGGQRVSLVTALSPDGGKFAACDFALDGGGPDPVRFIIRDTVGGSQLPVKTPFQWMRAVFRPNGGLLVIDRNERVRIVEPNGEVGREIHTFPRESIGVIPLLAADPAGATLVAVSSPRAPAPTFRPLLARLNTWDATTYQAGPVIDVDLSAMVPPKSDGASIYPTGGAFDSTGKRFAVAFAVMWQPAGRNRLESRGAVVVWDLVAGKEVFRKFTDEPLYTAGFDPQGRVFAAGGNSAGGVVRGWDGSTGTDVFTLRGHIRPILAVAFVPDGRVATGGMDRVVKVWDLASRREILTLDGFAREVTHLVFRNDEKQLVAATGVDLLSTLMMSGLPAEWPPAEVRVIRGPK